MKKQITIQERSFEFAISIIKIYRILNENREYVLSKQLLRSGTSVEASKELFNLIQRALQISNLTDGAFDISYASMDKLWKYDILKIKSTLH